MYRSATFSSNLPTLPASLYQLFSSHLDMVNKLLQEIPVIWELRGRRISNHSTEMGLEQLVSSLDSEITLIGFFFTGDLLSSPPGRSHEPVVQPLSPVNLRAADACLIRQSTTRCITAACS
jgi:hypothetical protein